MWYLKTFYEGKKSRLKVKKCCHLLHADVISFFVTKKCKKIQKHDENVNIDRENLHIF